MNNNIYLLIAISVVVSIALGIISNVVANLIQPHLEKQLRLTISIFLGLIMASILTTILLSKNSQMIPLPAASVTDAMTDTLALTNTFTALPPNSTLTPTPISVTLPANTPSYLDGNEILFAT